jgi:tetratricopeptide (TPR) repeat protein
MLLVVVAAAMGLCGHPSRATGQSPASPDRPAEEQRFDARAFHEGLKQRGLTELLDLHLRDYPPRDAASRLLLQREIRLARWRDDTLPIEQRRQALDEANQLLEQLINSRGDDRRRFDWQRTLAESYLYDLGEPSFQSILLRGGTSEDRVRLGAAAEKAVRTLQVLRADLDKEYQALDALPLPRFEALEHQGIIDEMERLVPLVDYLLAWATFYDVVHRDDADPFRASLLHEVKDLIGGLPGVLTNPHGAGNPRIEATVLVGMCDRRLNDHGPARSMLTQAIDEAARVTDAGARRRADWAVTLAWIERVRNEADIGDYNAALALLGDFQAGIAGRGRAESGLRIAAGLLARSVLRSRAEASERAGRASEAAQHRTESWMPLASLIGRSPESRAEIYAVLYELIDPDGDVARLDPLEQSALIARLLADAADAATPDARDDRLDRAIRVAEGFLRESEPALRDLRPEVLFNLGVALHQRGRSEEAVRRFLEIAHDFRDYDNAKKATSIAVELGGGLLAGAATDAQDRIREIYLDALEQLVTHFAGSDEAKYYRFFYAQLLEEMGRHDTAATHYGLIAPDHEHYLRSLFQRLRCRASALDQRTHAQPADRVDVRRRIDEFTSEYRGFLKQAGDRLSGMGSTKSKEHTRRLMAKAMLVDAEVQLLPEVDRAVRAIEQIDRCAADFADLEELTSRILRIRIRALEQLGRLDEATAVIPKFIAADPVTAGPTLQELYGSMVAASRQFADAGDEAGARTKARAALMLAEQIDEWASKTDLPVGQRRALAVQRAEAELRAGEYETARARFARCLGVTEGAIDPDQIDDWRTAMGYAESLFQLGRHEAALPLFNRLALGLTPDQSLYWKMLLRDLQCRTALGHDPRGIIRVIEQKQFTHPDLGGSPYADELERLLRENQRSRSP